MSQSRKDAPLLNANQRRSIEALLESVETTLYEIERLMPDTTLAEAGVTSVSNDLPSSFSEAAPDHIAAARALIRSLADRVQLDRRRVSKRRAVRGMLAAQLVRLDDITPAKFRSYGEVHPDFTREITPAVHEIQGIIRRLLAHVT